VDNPVDNLVIKVRRGVMHIGLPINYPDLHNLSIAELLDLPQARNCLDLYRGLNTDIIKALGDTVIKMRVDNCTEKIKVTTSLCNESSSLLTEWPGTTKALQLSSPSPDE
jgi:hypothetical protein